MSEERTAVDRKPDFLQVCVWPACTLGHSTPDDFVDFIAEQFKGVRVQYLEEIKTMPSFDNLGNPIAETGGRIDQVFSVHKDDIGLFAVCRLEYGIRWIEDVLDNEKQNTPDTSIYPIHFEEYRSW